MESIGEKLRGAREEKGYSIDQVARDTNIARRFVEALEREDFSVFPGDPYVLGFLRNYADYLGLEPEKVITLYKNLKIQEQPIPVEDLIHRKRKIPFGLIAIGLLAVTLLGGGGYGVYYFFQNRPAGTQEQTAAKTPTAEDEAEADYLMREEILEQRFSRGDRIRIQLGDNSADLVIETVGERVELRHGGGLSSLALGREEILDLNGDGREDIKTTVQDIDTKAETTVLRFDRSLFDASGATASREELEDSEASQPAVGSTNAESREQKTQIILSGDKPEAFQISAVFRGYCLLRYLKDSSIREERYFHKGESFRLDVSREATLWISNAGSFKARVAGEEVSFGGPGEVSTKLIRWEESEDGGNYHLKLIPVY